MSMLDPLSDKAQKAAHAGRLWSQNGGPPNTRSETEKWLEDLGSKFVVVWLYAPKSTTITSRGTGWMEERHIDDPETLETTVSMSLERLGGKYAIWAYDGSWALLSRSRTVLRWYPTREAAEMVAIHGG